MDYWYVPIVVTGIWLLVLLITIMYFDRFYWKKYVKEFNYNRFIEGYLSHLPYDDYNKILELDLLDKEKGSLICSGDYVMYSNIDKMVILTLFRYSVGLFRKSYIYSLQYSDISNDKYPVEVKMDELGEGKLSSLFDMFKKAGKIRNA